MFNAHSAPCSAAFPEKKAVTKSGPYSSCPSAIFSSTAGRCVPGSRTARRVNQRCSEGPDSRRPKRAMRAVWLAFHHEGTREGREGEGGEGGATFGLPAMSAVAVRGEWPASGDAEVEEAAMEAAVSGAGEPRVVPGGREEPTQSASPAVSLPEVLTLLFSWCCSVAGE